jgi:phosphoribosylglycinamide formyltransferase-1
VKPARVPAVVLVSGSGSNLQALLDAAAADLPLEVRAVISNRPDAYGLERAARAWVPTRALDHTRFPDRTSFEAALAELIDGFEPELVLLAGFMRILEPDFVARYSGRMINIHPALLPAYPGLHTHRRCLEAGDAEHGASIHFVTAEVDGGPVFMQVRVPVAPDDDPDTLAARVLAQEHRLYPAAVRLLCAGRVRLQDGQVQLDGRPLTQPLQLEAAG